METGREYLTPGAYVMATVRNMETGITENVMEHIFEPFFTTKEVGQGTGLGLATVYGIMKQNQGHIWAESPPGKETLFTMHLPRVEIEPSYDTQSALDTILAKGIETILVVEDEPLVRTVIVATLQY